jgi:hypothetical protein
MASSYTSAVFRSSVLAIGIIAMSGCYDACGNTLIGRVDAPDGQHSAVLFQRDCGATTSFSTHVSVLDQGAKLTGSGNAFSADDDHGAAAVGDWGGPWAEVSWLAPDHLLVRYAAKSSLFEQKGKISGVRTSYQQVTR